MQSNPYVRWGTKYVNPTAVLNLAICRDRQKAAVSEQDGTVPVPTAPMVPELVGRINSRLIHCKLVDSRKRPQITRKK